MKKRYLIIVLVFLIAIVVGYFIIPTIDSVNSTSDEPEIASVITEFPKKSEKIYISNIAATEVSSDYAYLLEHRGAFVLKYDTEGNFIKKIGQPGRGPGELINPLDFAVDDERVYTLEQGKMQIQEFDENGEYADTYLLHGAYLELLKFSSGFLLKNYYYSGMPEYSDMPGADSYSLFTFYDPDEGTNIPFGTYPSFFNDLGIKESGSFSDIHNGLVYTGFKGFPYVHVLNSKGKIEQEIYLKGDGLEEVLTEYLENPKSSNSFYPSLFLDMKVNEMGIFLCTYGEELEILHFNFEGEMENKFIIEKKDSTDKFIRNFDLIDSENNNQMTLFATLQGVNLRTLIVDLNLN